MPSLADIPEHLHHPNQKTKFIEWLCLLPIPDNARRALVAAWTAETATPFTSFDWQVIKTIAPKSH